VFSAGNGDDLFDEFLGYDFTMGADVVNVRMRRRRALQFVFDDEVECPECGKKFKKNEKI